MLPLFLFMGAVPRVEFGPALQQPDALLYEPRRTLSELRRTLVWATPHPNLSHAAPSAVSKYSLLLSLLLCAAGRAYWWEKGRGEEPNHITSRKPGPL